jgi:hypothetical protein
MRGTTAAGKIMALHRPCDKAGRLFVSLSFVAWKPHPLPNDGPAHLLSVHFGHFFAQRSRGGRLPTTAKKAFDFSCGEV